MDFEFDWGPKKAAANLRKHKISFEEASTCFRDPLAVTFPDGKHSDGEMRYLTFGHAAARRILLISHTETGLRGIHIISARKADRNERKIYEEG